jgi:hypothetical protein
MGANVSTMKGGGLRTWLFDLAGRIPIVRETADPWIFTVLLLLVGLATFGVLDPNSVFPGDDDARAHVIQVAAGFLVILGAYFTAVNLREVRAHQAFDRLCRAVDQLGSESDAVRIGAVHLLESLALERLDLPTGSAGEVMRAKKSAIFDALEVLADDPAAGSSGERARQVLLKLER